MCQRLADLMIGMNRLGVKERALFGAYPVKPVVDRSEIERFGEDVELIAILHPKNRVASFAPLRTIAMQKNMNVVIVPAPVPSAADYRTRVDLPKDSDGADDD